jgi:hypothetical protein
MWGFSKIPRLFWNISRGFCKDYKAFKRHFQRSGGFFKLKWESYKDKKTFWRYFKRNGEICLVMWGLYRDFNYFWRIFQRNWGLWGFFKAMWGFLRYVSMTFIKTFAAEAFCSQSTPVIRLSRCQPQQNLCWELGLTNKLDIFCCWMIFRLIITLLLPLIVVNREIDSSSITYL